MDEYDFAARERLIYQALRFVQARLSADMYPENAHSGDEIDYAADELESAARAFVSALREPRRQDV